MGHDKDSIYYYNSYILKDLREKVVKFKKVHYWSDGPSNHSKNQFVLTNLKFHKNNHEVAADWNFFATAHGNGGNDGLSVDIKNDVWRKALQMKIVVQDVQDFVEAATKKFPSSLSFAQSMKLKPVQSS